MATSGDDRNIGNLGRPLKTVQRAADLAQPGDVITVHQGVYRERVSPPRGGDSPERRIIYQAVPGERVEVKGSELISGWKREQGEVWKVVVPNGFFKGFNPFTNELRGDWFDPRGRKHHTGAVYLNGDWLVEAAKLELVLQPEGTAAEWFAVVTPEETTLYARFPQVDPNQERVEVNVRQTVFYPTSTGINYLTVRGFVLRDAATPWAPPTAEQMGVIGTHWSKGWIIESNLVSHSICSGIALGKYGDQWDNTSADTAEGYVETVNRALKNGWNQETVGGHLVRGNEISHCEQAGIVGSLGAVFSTIRDNSIHDIHERRLFSGAEMAGIKLHGAIDVQILHNHIYRTCRGIWLDWMAQGTRVSGNLLHENQSDDVFAEVDHGPFLLDNNLLLSAVSVRDWSEGGAYVHNLFAGKLDTHPELSRSTPFHPAHATTVAGLTNIHGGDDRFLNNVFLGQGTNVAAGKNGYGLAGYDNTEYPILAAGNAYYRGAAASSHDTNHASDPGFDPQIKVVESGGRFSLVQNPVGMPTQPLVSVVSSSTLGISQVARLPFVAPDGSSIVFNLDYLGRPRSAEGARPGPLEKASDSILIW